MKAKGFYIIMILLSSLCVSCATWNGSIGQQAAQHVAQHQRGGKYIGNASSQTEARSMATKAGYRYYEYYPSTGECFGYN